MSINRGLTSEQFLRAIWNAVSRATVLILPQIKLNSQLKNKQKKPNKNKKKNTEVWDVWQIHIITNYASNIEERKSKQQKKKGIVLSYFH